MKWKYEISGPFLTQDSVQVIDGFSMIRVDRVDCAALEARFLRPCLSSDLPVSRSDLLIVDLASAHVRSCRKKHLQGWSFLNRHLDPMSLESKLRVASRAKESDSSNATTKVEHVPCEPSLLANTRLVLASMGMSPVENFAEAYCWWHALKGLAKIPFLELFLRVIDQVLACHQMSIYEAWFSLFGPVTGTEQIAVAVSALSDLFPTGLLILHADATSVGFGQNSTTAHRCQRL